MLVSFCWGYGEHLIDQFRRPVNAEYASLLLKLNAGSYDAIRTDWRVPLLTNWISFCFIILKTLLYFASAPLVWLVATRRQINLQSYWQLLRRHAVALFLFLLMIEIIIHQLQTFYAYGVPPFRVLRCQFRARAELARHYPAGTAGRPLAITITVPDQPDLVLRRRRVLP